MGRKVERYAKKWTGIETLKKAFTPPEIPAPEVDTSVADALRAQAVQSATANADLTLDNIATINPGGSPAGAGGTRRKRRVASNNVSSGLGINI